MCNITWIEAITTDSGLLPSNGFKIGIKVFMTKFVNLSPLTVPSTIWTSCRPCRDSTAIPEYLVPRIRSLWSRGGIPLNGVPKFSCAVTLITPCLVYPDKHRWVIHCHFSHKASSALIWTLQSNVLYPLLSASHVLEGFTNCRLMNFYTNMMKKLISNFM